MISNLFLVAAGDTSGSQQVSDLVNSIGAELFEDEIDEVLMMTNQFLTDSAFIGEGGPFWYVLQMSMCLGALFAVIRGAGMAYKMMIKGEPFDPLEVIRVLGVALVMIFWYGDGNNNLSSGNNNYSYQFDGSVLDVLAYIPNCIGSWTHDLYYAEEVQVKQKFDELKPLIAERDEKQAQSGGEIGAGKENVSKSNSEALSPEKTVEAEKDVYTLWFKNLFSGAVVGLDKILIFISLIMFRIGWWGTIFVQQVCLGMLTIFGPIQWAFSLLPKWEGAWAKWITRYLTVQFYGAMLYFVGFYVLLLYDIVLSLELDQLAAVNEQWEGYMHSAFFTGGYLLVAGAVSLKCLSLVPDFASWMIPEGETAFSTRSFGEGVVDSTKQRATGIMSGRFV